MHSTPLTTELAALEYWKFAVEKNRTALIDAGVQLGINVNARNSWGWSAVTHAVMFNRSTCLKCLLKHGADANIMSEFFVSSLTLARMLKNTKIEAILTQHLKKFKQLDDVTKQEEQLLNPFQQLDPQQWLYLLRVRLEKEQL